MSSQPEPIRVGHDRRRREGGAALLVAVLMLALMGLIGFASMDTVMRDRQVAGNTSRSQLAVYAADAGVADGLDVLRTASLPSAPLPGKRGSATRSCLTPTVPTGTLLNGATYGAVSPADDEICMLAWAEQCIPDTDSGLNFYYSVWDIRTRGQAPGGSTAEVHATAVRCHVAGY